MGSRSRIQVERSLLELGDLSHRLGEVLDGGGGDTSHGDATVAGHVNVVLGGELVALLGGESRVAEHADLLGDVGPVASGAGGLEVVNEEVAHLDDSIGHDLNVLAPLGGEVGVSEDGGDEASATDGRVGVVGADEDLELRIDAGGLGGAVGQNVEGTNALTVQTEVLRERLRNQGAVALLDEVAHGPDVAFGVARSEALVRHVEEHEVALLLAHLGDLLPLLLRRIDSRRIVRAHVEQEDRTSGCRVQIRQQTDLVQTDRVRVVVTVRLHLKARILRNRDVVTPRGVRQVHRAVLRQEAAQKVCSDSQRARSGQCLRSHDLLTLQHTSASSEDQVLRRRIEVGETRDTYGANQNFRFQMCASCRPSGSRKWS